MFAGENLNGLFGRPDKSESATLLSPVSEQLAEVPAGPPILLVAIDTEAEFDWQGPFARNQTNVRNLRRQTLAQRVFDRYGVRPIYLVDYAVATQPDGYLPLREILQSGRCEIGAHLHPWITPPFEEELGDRESFSNNLPPALQRAKLARLTDAVTENFGFSPVAYRAGRYGVGDEIAEILASLGYQIDMSVLPGIDMRPVHGPDFRRAFVRPYWFGDGSPLLEIPGTADFVGICSSVALPRSLTTGLYDMMSRRLFKAARATGICARLGIIERITLTPEGMTIGELRRLTEALLSRDNRVFVFSYHSSSLLPGSTQYVKSEAELSAFLERIEQYLEYFLGELGGITMTAQQLWELLQPKQDGTVIAAPLTIAAQ